jgi:hypothetical protein
MEPHELRLAHVTAVVQMIIIIIIIIIMLLTGVNKSHINILKSDIIHVTNRYKNWRYLRQTMFIFHLFDYNFICMHLQSLLCVC